MATSSPKVETLGCGIYEVYFRTRGGESNVCRAQNITSVAFNRTLNDISEATIEITMRGQTEECCACIGSINPWEHEISIYRDSTEVWCGPVTGGSIDLAGAKATFTAKDLMTWTDHRWIEIASADDYDVEDVDSSTVFDWVMSHVYAKDQWNMSWSLTESGVPISRTYFAFQEPDRWGGTYPNAGKELRDISQYGIDWTVIRRSMIGGALEINPPLPYDLILRDQDWSKLPIITIVGSGMATEFGEAGGAGGYGGWADDQIWIERPNDESRQRYGLLQTFESDPSLDEEDTTVAPNAIAQKAYGKRQLKKDPFVYVQGGELSASAPIPFSNLIPGVGIRIQLSQTCRTIEADYRLTNVDVSFSDGNETIAVKVTPKGVDAIKDSL